MIFSKKHIKEELSLSRHLAREIILQTLYEIDITGKSVENVLKNRFTENQLADNEKKFIEKLLFGTQENLTKIDELIENYALQWKLSRMSIIDRNILRLAVFEIKFCQDIPKKVAVNEAIELSKEYGTANSAKFVNGILGKILDELGE